MTTILALTNLAILKQDAYSPTLELLTVMITTFAPLTDALKIKQNVFTLLSTVMTTILALLTLAIKFLDANTLLWVSINLMTTTLAPEISAQFKTESNTSQSPVITEINAASDLAMLLEVANIPKKYVTTTISAQLILAQMETVFSLPLFAKNKTVRPFLAI
jgi:hypothetical protein